MTTQTEIKAQRKTELPEGWENYSICKEKIPDTPFLAFKVPLNKQLQGWYSNSWQNLMKNRIFHNFC